MSFDTSIQTTRNTDPPIWRDTVPNRSIRQTDSHPFDFERSSVNFKGFHLRAGSLSLSRSLTEIFLSCVRRTRREKFRDERDDMVPGERSASKKTKFPAKFYRCKYSFWFRPARNTSRPRRGNNVRPWRRVGSRERDLSLPPWITEFRTRDDKFRKFPRPFLLNDIAIFDRVLAGIRYFIFHVFEAFLFLLFLDGVPYRRIRIIFEIPIHKFTGSVIVFFRTEQNRNESFFLRKGKYRAMNHFRNIYLLPTSQGKVRKYFWQTYKTCICFFDTEWKVDGSRSERR